MSYDYLLGTSKYLLCQISVNKGRHINLDLQ